MDYAILFDGPKSYVYRTNLENETVHIKGFCLNNEKVKEKLNFTSLLSCVKNNNQIIEGKYERKINRDKFNHIFIDSEDK